MVLLLFKSGKTRGEIVNLMNENRCVGATLYFGDIFLCFITILQVWEARRQETVGGEDHFQGQKGQGEGGAEKETRKAT